MRDYIVIPAGVEVVRVRASSPRSAAHKVSRGKGEVGPANEPLVVASTRTRRIGRQRPFISEHQITIEEALSGAV